MSKKIDADLVAAMDADAVYKQVKAAEVSGIVETVCAGVVDAETGAYHPELKDYFLRVAVIKTYTNIELTGNNCRPGGTLSHPAVSVRVCTRGCYAGADLYLLRR